MASDRDRNAIETLRKRSGQAQLIQILLGIQRRHATEPGRSYRLTIHLIGDVARSEYTRHAGHRCPAVQT